MNKETLAREIADLLSLPYEGRQGKAYEVVKVILATIVKGLRKREAVKIDGFGIFRIETRPATRHGVDPRPFHKTRGGYVEVVEFPPTQRVVFRPSKPLKRFIQT